MNKLFIDLSDKPDDFKIILLPTCYSTCCILRSRIFKRYTDINIKYYIGIDSIYKSIKAPLECDIEFEKNKLKESILCNKITDTFNITKKDLTPDIIKKFRWCEPLIEYPEQKLTIDPYILGLWLGDGDSRSINLTSIDTVLIDYWKNYAEENNLTIKNNNSKIRKNKPKEGETELVNSYRISSNYQIHHNPILIEFQKLNLINNKHIPEIFLNNSVENRLRLLAGIIDTDGYLGNSKYEIIQKNKILSDNIVTLANSLGFFTTCFIKKAYASNTELKTVRDYNRIYIFINQVNLEIPVLLERKKIKSRKNFFNPKILINDAKLAQRILWNDKLDTFLIESVKSYQSVKGKKLIPWTKIVNEIEEFNGYSPGALKKRYESFT